MNYFSVASKNMMLQNHCCTKSQSKNTQPKISRKECDRSGSGIYLRKMLFSWGLYLFDGNGGQSRLCGEPGPLRAGFTRCRDLICSHLLGRAGSISLEFS